MHGPAFDDSGEIIESDVHTDNIAAFKAAGWVEGKLKNEAPAVQAAPAREVTSTTPNRCAFMLKSGKQCGKDAVKGSEFCATKGHK